jgi:hypothetical protein
VQPVAYVKGSRIKGQAAEKGNNERTATDAPQLAEATPADVRLAEVMKQSVAEHRVKRVVRETRGKRVLDAKLRPIAQALILCVMAT